MNKLSPKMVMKFAKSVRKSVRILVSENQVYNLTPAHPRNLKFQLYLLGVRSLQRPQLRTRL